jgi:thiamine transporter
MVLINILGYYSEEKGGYLPATAGFAVIWTAIIILLMLGAFVVSRRNSVRLQTTQLVFCAMAIALAAVTSMLKIYHFPFGGSITLFSMLFITAVGYWYGTGIGVMTGVAYGFIQLMIDPQIYFPLQVIVDYVLAFGALGLSGIFAKSKNGLVKGYLVGVLGRYFFAVISGALFFGEYAWDGWAPIPYSLAYNGAYIGAEMALTLVVLAIPAVRNAFDYVKRNACVEQSHA